MVILACLPTNIARWGLILPGFLLAGDSISGDISSIKKYMQKYK